MYNPPLDEERTFAMEKTEGALHVVPVADMREHEMSPECWCNPRITEEGVVVHNSMDGREKYENGGLLH